MRGIYHETAFESLPSYPSESKEALNNEMKIPKYLKGHEFLNLNAKRFDFSRTGGFGNERTLSGCTGVSLKDGTMGYYGPKLSKA